MFKKLLFVTSMLPIFIATSGSAADLPRKSVAPIIAPPAFTWTGFYAGLNAGYTWGQSSVGTTAGPTFGNAGLGCGGIAACPTSAALTANSSLNPRNSGFIGGLHIGYNMQSGATVAGIEADIMGIARDGKGSSVTLNSGPIAGFAGNSYTTTSTIAKSLDYLGTVRLRLGVLATPQLLLYATGGFAYGQANLTSTFDSTIVGPNVLVNPFGGSFSSSRMKYGYTIGGGAEYKFNQNFSARIEYLWYDLGKSSNNFSYTQVNAGGTQFLTVGGTSTTRFNGHIVRAGISYHF
jgi:outer membrane immunogenic protein